MTPTDSQCSYIITTCENFNTMSSIISSVHETSSDIKSNLSSPIPLSLHFVSIFCSLRFAISSEVRRSIDRTMQAELSRIGHWHQLNGPTVQILQIGYCQLISHSSRPGRAETTCLRQVVQSVKNPGGQPDRMAAKGVSRDRRWNIVIRSRN